jgi:hypothetical protein
MHKTVTRNLRFGCGASLHSGFLYAHKQYWKDMPELNDKENVNRLTDNRQRGRGSNK